MRKKEQRAILDLLHQRKPQIYEELWTTGCSTEELLFRFQLEEPELYNQLLEEVVGGEEVGYRGQLK